ncbi:unnamed protein product [Parajaminaea phylloscopi]
MASSASVYPASVLALPLSLQHRLPPQLQGIDPQTALVLHTLLAFVASAFTVHPSYSLPLCLFGLVATHASLASLLPHFLFLWVLSTPLDVVWLLYKGHEARLIVSCAVGASMVLKLPSAAAVAQVASREGFVARDSGGEGRFAGFAGVGASIPGGLWSGGASADERDVPGGYNSIYDDEEEEADGAGKATHASRGGDLESGRSAAKSSPAPHPGQTGRGGYASID